MQRWWVSWEEPIGEDGDWRPFKVPVPKEILKYWCSGYGGDFSLGAGEGFATICAVVEASDEAAIKKAAEEVWNPQDWRFIDKVEPGWRPNDRFPWGDDKDDA